jgi:HAD superfamily hydrolase (TIGR01509 family)
MVQENPGLKPRTIGALIFDLDGLLVDSEPLAASAMVKFLQSFGVEQDPAVHEQLLGRRLPEAIAISQKGYGLPGSLDELTLRYGQMRLDALRGAVKAMPGAHEIIAFGREQNLPIALATSGMREHADISLAETGLAGKFDAEVTGDEVERGKPAPDLFLQAAARLGVSPETAVVFEDSPLGVEAGIAASMTVIAVEGGRTVLPPFPFEPDLIVSTLIDALNWLKEQKMDPSSAKS